MLLVGDNSLVSILRILTSLELYLHCDFYNKHPAFSLAVTEHHDLSLVNLLPLSVSASCLDSGLKNEDLIKQEAILNCYDGTWSPFLCILGLSSVIGNEIFTYYPDCGDIRPKLLFNRHVNPRLANEAIVKDVAVHILFCYEGKVKSGESFLPNHYVPLLCSTKNEKHKVCNKKRKHPDNSSLQEHQDIKRFFQLSCIDKPSNSNFKTDKSSLSTLSIDKSSSLDATCYKKPPSDKIVSFSEASSLVDCHIPLNFDVATFREKRKGMSDGEIYNLIVNVYRPDENFEFPKTNGRSFRYDWLERYEWLCYSPSLDGGFCLPCVLFGDNFKDKASKISNLFSQPLRRWTDASKMLKRHDGKESDGKMSFHGLNGLHASTFPVYSAFKSNMSGKTKGINVIIDSKVKKEVEGNRAKLSSITDTVLTCGRLGLAFRGHRDDGHYHPETGNFSAGGVGNFVELLNFRVRAGDKVLEDHLNSCGRNQTYISKTSQNKLIKCCGEVITDKIISDLKASRFYSVIADEARDISNTEQMSLVLRFIDQNMDIREEFVGFLPCKWGLKGEQLAKVVLDALGNLGLSIADCRGQGYDGAGAVAGHINGMAAHLRRLNDKALFTHCYSHRLNLAICESINIMDVKSMLNRVKKVSDFFNISPTRQIPLEKNIDLHGSLSAGRKKKLIDVCRTRWVERIDGLDTFQQLLIPVFKTLREMKKNVDKDHSLNVSSDASELLDLLEKFDFVVALVICRNVFDSTIGVTQLLQGKSIDIMDGLHLITSLKTFVVNVRNSIDKYHDTWYEESLALARELDIDEAKPRTVGRQTTRANVPYKTTSEYYKRIFSIPLVDHLNSALKARFNTDSVNVYNGLSIVPYKMISLLNNGMNWKEKFKVVSNFYHDDLPNPLALDSEILLWETYWVDYEGTIPDSISATLKALKFEGFENIKIILRILGTLTITSCECERSFSVLRELKNYKRSTMVSERLNGLAMMRVHQEIVPETSEVIDRFAMDNTRLKFV